MEKEKKDLTKRIILRDKTICGTGVNPLELCLVVKKKDITNEIYNERKTSLSYSFEES